jgi:hypothetical protein
MLWPPTGQGGHNTKNIPSEFLMNTNKTIWIILGIIGMLVILCGCGVSALLATGAWAVTDFVQETNLHITTDPGQVAKIGADIAGYSVPDGYHANYGMSADGIKFIGYIAQSDDCHINLLQLGPNGHIGLDEMEREMKESTRVPKMEWFDLEMVTIEQKIVTIRGEEHLLTVREGTNKSGKTYRVALVQFAGKGGPALLAVSGSLAHWDMTEVEQFIAEME